MFTPQPSLSWIAEIETASLVLSAAQDKCEMGEGRPLETCPGGNGRILSVPELSVRITSLKLLAKLAGPGVQPIVIGGCLVDASFVPSRRAARRPPRAD